ncbi:MAG TPA: CAP domain-containing protein [Syntrophales bacterium]|nr:CAP domain-containing protein [Syntrophales bacterium]HPI58461.1 CAP domain-containing protein [Syntrophales bacterium]HPN25961.1 CAP domain-containing protein [Syntrophales bacterium]HQM28799.1 CAP domain-containing protein [Syntrophales bacterium]
MRIHAKAGIFVILTCLCLSGIQAGHPSSTGQTAGAKSVDSMPGLEHRVMIELNEARTRPRQYAAGLAELRKHFKGNEFHRPGKVIILTKEGVSAVDEAITFLRSAKPLSALKLSRGMSRGARDHVIEQGPAGLTGHDSITGNKPWDRVSRYGIWREIIGENISYGSDEAKMVVMGLIIDDGVPDRGHRKNIFNSRFRVAGVACGPHSSLGTMCVITFAGGYEEKL